jgi:hypothetical protein
MEALSVHVADRNTIGPINSDHRESGIKYTHSSNTHSRNLLGKAQTILIDPMVSRNPHGVHWLHPAKRTPPIEDSLPISKNFPAFWCPTRHA